MTDLKDHTIDYTFLREYEPSVLFRHLVLPLKKSEFFILCAVCEESQQEVLESFGIVRTVEVSKNEILFFLSDFQIRQNLFALYQKSIMNAEHNQDYIHRFLYELLSWAIMKKSSDIHMECMESTFIIRFRIDGSLKVFFNFDKALYPVISSVIKLLCSLDITQKRKPLDGRFSLEIDNRKVDFRVSTMPTLNGESLVIRVLESFNHEKTLESLGFSSHDLKVLQKSIIKPHGLILITGPTGSGKTTTLYSILKKLNCEEKKIITVEDPVEYQLEGIQQIAVNRSIGLDFSEVLKNILRQDPDVIMIGEIRDKDSLDIALQASLTGHLVLATLHTNSCIQTLNRLWDLHAKPHIISSTLQLIVSQRLVLKRCECLDGCEKCNYTSFDGRIGLCESLYIDEKMSELILAQKNKDILEYAQVKGFKTLFEDATAKVKSGLTTMDEVNKVLGMMDE